MEEVLTPISTTSSVLGRSLQDLLLRLQWKESPLQRLRSILGRSLHQLLLRLQWREVTSLQRLRPVQGRSLPSSSSAPTAGGE